MLQPQHFLFKAAVAMADLHTHLSSICQQHLLEKLQFLLQLCLHLPPITMAFSHLLHLQCTRSVSEQGLQKDRRRWRTLKTFLLGVCSQYRAPPGGQENTEAEVMLALEGGGRTSGAEQSWDSPPPNCQSNYSRSKVGQDKARSSDSLLSRYFLK